MDRRLYEQLGGRARANQEIDPSTFKVNMPRIDAETNRPVSPEVLVERLMTQKEIRKNLNEEIVDPRELTEYDLSNYV